MSRNSFLERIPTQQSNLHLSIMSCTPAGCTVGAFVPDEAWIPWDWVIWPGASTKCPTSSAILGNFAAINVVVCLLSILCGHRKAVNTLTMGRLGHPNSSSWTFMWIASAGFHLASNAAVAALIGSYEGGTWSTWKFMLFFAARPRLSWIVLGFLSTSNVTCIDRILMRILPAKGSDDSAPHGDNHEDNPYRCTALSQFIAELVLQAIACYIMGAIVQQGSQSWVYEVWHNSDVPDQSKMMYAGALYYLVLGGLSLLALMWMLLRMAINKSWSSYKLYMRILLFMFLLSTWLGSWLFWVGFVKFMVGIGMYCPQKLASQASIWILFSLFGIFTGAGTH